MLRGAGLLDDEARATYGGVSGRKTAYGASSFGVASAICTKSAWIA
jgi:hypothetical protein